MSDFTAPGALAARVDEHVDFVAVCRLVGMDVPDMSHLSGRSVKVHCPFGHMHSDRGASAAFRVYADTNSGWCFAGCGYFSPVRLAAMAWDVDADLAAERLREMFGISVLEEVTWEAASAPVPEQEIDRAALAVALSEHCQREFAGRWATLQFDAKVSDVLSKCLTALEKVQTTDQAWRWLDVSKTVMGHVMEGERS